MDRAAEAGVALVAMSYDPVHVLSTFATENNITYPLLSDEGSHTIRALGLENHKIKQHNDHYGRETTDKHRGLPYPGTIEISADGRVAAKWFDISHRVRQSGAALLHESVDDLAPEVIDRVDLDGVFVQASVLRATYHPEQEQRLIVRLGIPSGRHVYVDPVPAGFTALDIELGGPQSLVAGTPGIPEGDPYRVAGIDATFQAVAGQVNIPVPFRIEEDEGNVTLSVTVSLQSCTDFECFPPTTAQLALPLAAGGVLRA